MLQALFRIFLNKPITAFETHIYTEHDQLKFDYRLVAAAGTLGMYGIGVRVQRATKVSSEELRVQALRRSRGLASVS